jgi:hypothetical protein
VSWAIPKPPTGREPRTFDGFWFFELERRGARVTTVDLPRIWYVGLRGVPDQRAEALRH